MQNRLYDEIAKKIASRLAKKQIDIPYDTIHQKVKAELRLKPRFQKQHIEEIEQKLTKSYREGKLAKTGNSAEATNEAVTKMP